MLFWIYFEGGVLILPFIKIVQKNLETLRSKTDMEGFRSHTKDSGLGQMGQWIGPGHVVGGISISQGSFLFFHMVSHILV